MRLPTAFRKCQVCGCPVANEPWAHYVVYSDFSAVYRPARGRFYIGATRRPPTTYYHTTLLYGNAESGRPQNFQWQVGTELQSEEIKSRMYPRKW